MASSSSTLSCLILMTLACTSAGSNLLQPSTLEQTFNEQVSSYAGKAPMNPEMPAIRKALEPMWVEAVRNEDGRLNNDDVFSVIDALFAKRRDWNLAGLNRVAAATTLAGISRDQVPSFLLEMFEEIFGKDGLMIHELALFAATLEKTIDQDPLTPDAWQKKVEVAEQEMFHLPSESSWSWQIALAVAGLGAVAAMDATRRFCGWKVRNEKAN